MPHTFHAHKLSLKASMCYAMYMIVACRQGVGLEIIHPWVEAEGSQGLLQGSCMLCDDSTTVLAWARHAHAHTRQAGCACHVEVA